MVVVGRYTTARHPHLIYLRRILIFYIYESLQLFELVLVNRSFIVLCPKLESSKINFWLREGWCGIKKIDFNILCMPGCFYVVSPVARWCQ